MTAPVTATPQTAAQWQHYLEGIDTPEKFQNAFATGEFKTNLTAYIEAQNKERTELLGQIKEQTQAQLTEWLKENQQSFKKSANKLDPNVAASAGARPSTALNNPRAAGAPLNGLYPDFYSFLQDAWFAQRGSLPAEN